MSGKIIIALACGILAGYFFIPEQASVFVGDLSVYILYGLLFLIGIDIGKNKESFVHVKTMGREILVTTGGTIIGSIIGGLISALIFKLPLNEGAAVAAGFGWYSLSAVMLASLAGATISVIAFMTNVFRELIAFISIPFIAKRLGRLCAIATAGATSMDTTLTIIKKSTNEETAVVSFTNGVLLSSIVPILVPFFYEILK